MEGALSGALSVSEISDASKSALRLPVYNIAVSVLRLRTNERKRERIESFPPDIQELVRKECRRLYDARKM